MSRIRSLDSLRGIAALIVVIYHVTLVVPGVHEQLWAIRPLRLLMIGQTAVIVFFVLSGYVLYLSLQRHDRDDYLTFAARRLTRLYPPVVVSILLSIGLYVAIDPGPLPALQGWFTAFSWSEPPSAALVAGHLLLFDSDRFHVFNNPMWSLVVEIRLSLLFPLIAAGVRRHPAVTVGVSVALSLFARILLSTGHVITPLDPVFTLQFLQFFAIGAAMARYSAEVATLVRRVPPVLVALGLAVALCFPDKLWRLVMHGSAVLLVAATISYPRLDRVLGLKPFVWLGERSFSLYLVHVPLIVAAVHALYGRLPIGWILAGAVVAALVVAELFWLAVERPSMRLSRATGRRMRARSG